MRSLFGGAVVADIPASLLDASDLREVPDHQEVFVGTMLDYDLSLIVELLEPVDKPTLTDALVYHIEETHRVSNTAEDEIDQPLEVSTMTFGAREFVERFDLVKSKDSAVSLSFGLFRLPEYETDVLITCILNAQKNGPRVEEAETQSQITRTVAKTFKVVDPSLFK